MSDENIPVFKVLLLGDSGVGKSCLLSRLVNDGFGESFKATIGIDFMIKMIDNAGKKIKLQIWDTSGQERFRTIINTYYQDARGIVLVFDLTNKESFNNVSMWLKEIDRYASAEVKKLLIGNKSDLPSDRAVDHSQAKEIADSLNIPYIETSAKDSNNVEQLFQTLSKEMMLTTPSLLVGVSNHSSQVKPVENAENSNSDHDHLVKLLIIGDSGVGKSSLLLRFSDEIFSENFLPTIGVDFKIRVIKHGEKTVKLQIWDTAGQERFRSITASYYRGSSGIIIVFDLTKLESYNNLTNWLNEVKRNSAENIKKLLVGNKCDLTRERAVDYDTVKNFADSLHIPYIETSAKDSSNVEKIFNTILSDILPIMSANTSEHINVNNGAKQTSSVKKSTMC